MCTTVTITDADEIIVMNSIKSSWYTMEERVLICVAFLHFVDFWGDKLLIRIV